MDKFKKSQILKLFLIVILLSITPLLSTSLRPPYLYFILNLLIIALGAEAGLLSFIFKAAEDKKNPPPNTTSVTQKPHFILTSEDPTNHNNEKSFTTIEETVKVAEKSLSEKIVAAVEVHKTLMKSPSKPSLFFIGGEEINEAEEFSPEDDGEDRIQHEAIGDELSRQELFHKAETFIGNFYKQLKMQREDSWNKIHGL